ncbi:MAG: NUDIX hydrolase [Tissierellia bacterium]|nr:NUDIX hydrolase [Tissierellia bacterium]
MSADCCFSNEDYWFRYRAAAIIIKDDKVLLATNEKEDYYYSIGGGVKLGERNEDAVIREVFEETGLEMEIDRLVFIHENFFKGEYTNKGKICHEVAFYYLMKYDSLEEMKMESLTEGGWKESLCWLDIDRFNEYKAHPSFFSEHLSPLPENIVHIVNDDL